MNRRETVACLWMVTRMSLLMVGVLVSALVVLGSSFWVGLQISRAAGLEDWASGPISGVIFMTIYGAGIGAYQCRSKLKKGEL